MVRPLVEGVGKRLVRIDAVLGGFDDALETGVLDTLKNLLDDFEFNEEKLKEEEAIKSVLRESMSEGPVELFQQRQFFIVEYDAMSVTTQVSEDSKTVTIAVQGGFDFNVHKDFRNACRSFENPGATYVIDMSAVTYMDTSALGMLLVLRKRVGGAAAAISIKNCSSEIRKILDISNFGKLFRFS